MRFLLLMGRRSGHARDTSRVRRVRLRRRTAHRDRRRRRGTGRPTPAEELPVTTPSPEEQENFGASCRTVVQGSRVTAHCRNPYPRTDRVRLHVECERWWDIDSDSAPVDVGPADYGELTGRCWKEVRSAWVTHQPADQAPDPAPVRGS